MSKTGAELPKTFSVGGHGTDVVIHNKTTDEEADRLKAEAVATAERIKANIQATKRKAKVIIPWGNRILIKRREVADKDGKIGSGILYASDKTKETLTEIADVVCVPDQTFCDEELIKNSEEIIKAHVEKAKKGDSGSSQFLLDFKEYLRLKTLKKGDCLFVGKYVGIDFDVMETGEKLSFMTPEGIYGEVVSNE